MKTLIVYATKYGGTRRCAEDLAKKLPGGADTLRITKRLRADLSKYDTVVIGTSVYMGKPRKELRAFVKRHMGALLEKRTGLYMCCMQDAKKTVEDQFAIAFPQALRRHAFAMALLGGSVDYAALNAIDRFFMKLVTAGLNRPEGETLVSTVDEERISRFAEIIAGAP